MKRISILPALLFAICVKAQLAFDPTFNNTNHTCDRTIRAVAVQSDQKIIIAGESSGNYYTSPFNYIARLNKDGTYDPTFNTLVLATSNVTHISALAVQPWDNKIIVGGIFSKINGNVVGNIARLNPDGSFDASFNSLGVGTNFGSVPGLNVYTIIVKDNPVPANRRILVCGTFTNYNNTAPATGPLVQLFDGGVNDGKVDNSFKPKVSTEGVLAMAIDNLGRLVIAGGFSQVGPTPVSRVARFTAAGALDASFLPGWFGPDDYVTGVAIDPATNKIVIGGNFTDYIDDLGNDHFVNYIARINNDRSLDATFNIGSGFDCDASCAGQTDPKNLLYTLNGDLLVSGRFTIYNGTSTRNLILIKTDGSVDPVYIPGSGFGDYVYAMAEQFPGGAADEKLIGGGTTNSFDPYYNTATATGPKQGSVMRLVVNNTTLPLHIVGFNALKSADSAILTWKTGVEGNNCYEPERSTDGIRFVPIGSLCSAAKGQSDYHFTDLPPRKIKYYYRIKEYENGIVNGFSKTIAVDFSSGEEAGDFILYPNPAKDHIFISGNFGQHSLKLMFYNANGSLLFRSHIIASPGMQTYRLSLPSNLGRDAWIQIADDSGKTIGCKHLLIDPV